MIIYHDVRTGRNRQHCWNYRQPDGFETDRIWSPSCRGCLRSNIKSSILDLLFGGTGRIWSREEEWDERPNDCESNLLMTSLAVQSVSPRLTVRCTPAPQCRTPAPGCPGTGGGSWSTSSTARTGPSSSSALRAGGFLTWAQPRPG